MVPGRVSLGRRVTAAFVGMPGTPRVLGSWIGLALIRDGICATPRFRDVEQGFCLREIAAGKERISRSGCETRGSVVNALADRAAARQRRT